MCIWWYVAIELVQDRLMHSHQDMVKAYGSKGDQDLWFDLQVGQKVLLWYRFPGKL